MTDSFIALKDSERRNEMDNHPPSHSMHRPENLAPTRPSPRDMMPSPGSCGDPTAWEYSHSMSPPPETLTERVTAGLHQMGAAVRDRVEELADHHREWQKESDVPSQKTPAVVDAQREMERQQMEKDQDRSFQATIV